MPKPEIIHGEGQRFQVEWHWVGVQDAVYRLKDGDTVLLQVDEDNPEVKGRHLVTLCELLNGLNSKVIESA